MNLVIQGDEVETQDLKALHGIARGSGIERIDGIADLGGRKAEVAAVTASAMRGEIDWPESLRRRVKALAGLDAGALEAVYSQRLRFNPGAEKLLAAARRAGLTTLLVSG